MTVGSSSKSGVMLHPAVVTPLFMGPDPPSKSESVVLDGVRMTYFQRYRNEILSKFSIPRYQWGTQEIPYSPISTTIVTATRRKIDRELALPTNDISSIDVQRMREVDDLYKGIQIHRSQYKDRTGTFHPLTYFKSSDYEYQCAPGMTTSYISKYPQNYITYKTPIVLPLTYSRRNEIPEIPDLSLTGIYNKKCCIAYKR